PPLSPLFPYTTLFRSGFSRALVDRMRGRQIVTVLQIEFCGLRAAADEARARERTGASQNCAPGDLPHDIVLPDLSAFLAYFPTRSEEHTSELQSPYDL